VALVHCDWRQEGQDTHATTLHAWETRPDGLVLVNIVFEEEQEAEAWAEMEERFLALLSPEEAAVWEPCRRMIGAIGPRDWEEMLGPIAPDFVGQDHRPAGWGTVGREDFLELYRSSIAMASDAWYGLTDVERVTSEGVVARGEGYGTTTEGGEFHTYASIAFHVRDGLVTRVDYFPVDEPHRAHAALEELPGNRAFEVARSGSAALARLDELAPQYTSPAGLHAV
jgi:hypothetical protein